MPNPSEKPRTLNLTVNGERRQVTVSPDKPLLWVLRDELGLCGTRYGCGLGVCGSCTVVIDGEARRSCRVPVGSIETEKVLTIEGLSADGSHALQRAWIEESVAQCGYCQAAQILTAHALLLRHPRPTDDDIDRELRPIVCRCGTYLRIRRAIHRAARETS